MRSIGGSTNVVDVVACTLLSVLRNNPQALASDVLPKLLQSHQDDRPTAHDLMNFLGSEQFDFANAAKALRAKEAAAIPYLIELMKGDKRKQQQAALTVCVGLSYCPEHCNALVEDGAVKPLVRLLKDDDAEGAEQAAEILMYFCF
jgi:hypothetical protein